MSAGKYNMLLEQGAHFGRTITWYTNRAKTATKDLSGYSALLIGKSAVGGTIYFSLTSGAGEITLGGAAGTISFPGLNPTLINAMDFVAGEFQLYLTHPSNNDNRLLEGPVELSKQL
ncbi:MAG: hypothetical protein KAJ19_08005 [Gammaproteobacteria bacterium]|nr:hypothetical protein [Gammaproteobacteria bacterium]